MKKHQRQLLDCVDLEENDENLLGKGTYGAVYRAARKSTGEPVAVKFTFPQPMGRTGAAGNGSIFATVASLREIKILGEVRHPNVVTLVDHFVERTPPRLALVYEYSMSEIKNMNHESLLTVAIVETDLYRILAQCAQTGRKLSDDDIQHYVYQLLQGINYLHENWIMHRDLKPANILIQGRNVDANEPGTLKIAGKQLYLPAYRVNFAGYVVITMNTVADVSDFGMARIYQSPARPLREMEKTVVTLSYRAPELLMGTQHYTKAIDMWAVGCIFADVSIELRSAAHIIVTRLRVHF